MHYELQEISGLYMELGEGPCWANTAEAMWFVNITGKELVTYSLSTHIIQHYSMPEMVGAVVPMADGRAMLALADGIYAFNLCTESLERLWTLERGDSRLRFNDGKCSPDGRFFVGTMDHMETDCIGSLYRMDGDGHVTRVVEGVGTSNGLCWSMDGGTLYYVDTPTHRVDAFDYSVETGAIRNRRTAITLDNTHGGPDGMTIDTQGRIWLAEWGGARVSVWDVSHGMGVQVDEIQFGCKCVSACAFGPDGVLYVTTAVRDDGNEFTGKVYAVQTEAEGLPAFEYKHNLEV